MKPSKCLLPSFLSLLLILIGSRPTTTDAHRSLPSGITCGPQFSSPDTPLTIPNPAVSWANYAIISCDDPIMWYEADVDANQTINFLVTVPELERFRNTRMAVAFLGPGLPQLVEEDDTDDFIPIPVKQYAADNGLGIAVYYSPQDQSTCDHLMSEEMFQASDIKDGRCHFYESHSGSNMWVIMDDELIAPIGGNYKIALYEQFGYTAKASFACCDWREDFVTPYDTSETECDVCGSSSSENPAWLSLFFEQKTMADYGGYPPLQNCITDLTHIALPVVGSDKCPPTTTPSVGGGSDDINNVQPPSDSCVLGCDNTGECYSHNILEECTHVLDWELEPKFGDAIVNKIIIFKGDTIRFIHSMEDGLAHNLYELTNETAFEICNFDGSTNLANVEETSIGHDITFNKAGEFYFACNIGCEVPAGKGEGSSGTAEFEAHSRPTQWIRDAAFCHCSRGQKLTVEVKHPMEGLQCHIHGTPKEEARNGDNHQNANNWERRNRSSRALKKEWRRLNSTITTAEENVTTALECLPSTENGYIINNPIYGAMSESECTELCAPTVAISFMAGVELGSCIDFGYVYNATMKNIQPPGSPAAVNVRVTLNAPIIGDNTESMVNKDDVEDPASCHCHSYKYIGCSEEEEESDESTMLYAKYIDEIEEFCRGILDETDAFCPYRCFQLMETLHLHYLECPSRTIDPTYIAVAATQMCHFAVVPPPGTADCPVAVLPTSYTNGKGEEEEEEEEEEEMGEEGNRSNNEKSLSTGAIAGVVVGSLAFIEILVYFVVSKCKTMEEPPTKDQLPETSPN